MQIGDRARAPPVCIRVAPVCIPATARMGTPCMRSSSARRRPHIGGGATWPSHTGGSHMGARRYAYGWPRYTYRGVRHTGDNRGRRQRHLKSVPRPAGAGTDSDGKVLHTAWAKARRSGQRVANLLAAEIINSNLVLARSGHATGRTTTDRKATARQSQKRSRRSSTGASKQRNLSRSTKVRRVPVRVLTLRYTRPCSSARVISPLPPRSHW